MDPLAVCSTRIARLLPVLLSAVGLTCGPAVAAEYDPLVVADGFNPATLNLVVQDKARNRAIPLKVYLPASRDAEPVILFSHGLGGNREGSSYLGRHWAARGYIVVFMQHPGSDDSVWKGVRLRELITTMKKAASMENFMLRVKDVPAVLDQLEKWNADSRSEFSGRLNMEQIGMSGHSFGARTTQAVSGQLVPGAPRLAETRIQAAIALSPSTPQRGDPNTAFGSVKVPWLLMTGTKDVAPIGGQTVESRLAVFPALPDGDHYELVLHNAEHSAFGDRAMRRDKEPRNPNHHRVILALSTAFWDAHLRSNSAAKAWLSGSGPRSVLEKDDRWRRK